MLTLKQLVINSKATLGENLKLVGIAPAYEYRDGKRLNDVVGYRYSVVSPTLGYDKIDIKVLGEQPLVDPEKFQVGQALPIVLVNPQIKVFQDFRTKEIKISATADSARLLGGGNK